MVFRNRTIADTLRRGLTEVPVLAILGPRRVGKTTLIRHLFGGTHRYCPLNDPAIRRQAREDPLLLMERFPPPVIFDELQFVPEFIEVLRGAVGREASLPGRYILIGSRLQPMASLLAAKLGMRVQICSLLSMSLQEIAGRPEGARPWYDLLMPAAGPQPDMALPSPLATARQILRGGFPEPALAPPEQTTGPWHSAYVQEFLERDTRFLRSAQDLDNFERFVFALATRSGQLLNLEELAREVGITGKTAKAWIEVLESTGQVLVVQPLDADVGKRLVRRCRVYFLDTGTLAFLLNATQPDQVLAGIAAAPLFESAVAGQLARLLCHRGDRPRIHFWETAAGHRVDFVVDNGQHLIPIDAMLSSTPTPRDSAGIEEFQRMLGGHVGRGVLVCLGRRRIQLSPGVDAVPLGAF